MSIDDPQKIADDLIVEHGLDGAIDVAVNGAAAANDNYVRSVWREVKAILRHKKTGADGDTKT